MLRGWLCEVSGRFLAGFFGKTVVPGTHKNFGSKWIFAFRYDRLQEVGIWTFPLPGLWVRTTVMFQHSGYPTKTLQRLLQSVSSHNGFADPLPSTSKT